jgi:hypothetical protein
MRIVNRTLEGHTMKHDVFECRALEAASVAAQAAHGNAERRARRDGAPRNWAWAHQHDAYDWMESAGPFSLDDIAA